MYDFSNETFVQAAHILDTYGADAARAAEVLRRPGSLRDNAAMLAAPETGRLRETLLRDTPAGRIYCIVGGLQRRGEAFHLNLVHYVQILYLLHSDIASMRGHIDGLRSGPAQGGGQGREDVIRLILQDRIDTIRFRSRVLAEMMLHLSRIAEDPYLPGLLLRRGDLKGPPPGTTEEEEAGAARLNLLVRDYYTRIGEAGTDLGAHAFDKGTMAARLREFPANPLPVWIGWRDEPEAQVLDDVWIPKELFAPIMQLIAGQASHALAPTQAAAQ